jgi:hypothetical protein
MLIERKKAKGRIVENGGDPDQTYTDLDLQALDSEFNSFMEEIQSSEFDREKRQDLVASLLLNWSGGDLDDDQLPENGHASADLVKEVFFSCDDDIEAFVPRFSKKGDDGVLSPLYPDDPLFQAAQHIGGEKLAELDTALENLREKYKPASTDDEGNAIPIGDLLEASLRVASDLRKEEKEVNEAANESLQTALSEIDVVQCDYGGMNFRDAFLTYVVKCATEVERQYQESMGFLAKK